jgi:hypothetical protein
MTPPRVFMGWTSKSDSLSGFPPLTIVLADPEPVHWLAPASSKTIGVGVRGRAEVRNQVGPLTAAVKKLPWYLVSQFVDRFGMATSDRVEKTETLSRQGFAGGIKEFCLVP